VDVKVIFRGAARLCVVPRRADHRLHRTTSSTMAVGRRFEESRSWLNDHAGELPRLARRSSHSIPRVKMVGGLRRHRGPAPEPERRRMASACASRQRSSWRWRRDLESGASRELPLTSVAFVLRHVVFVEPFSMSSERFLGSEFQTLTPDVDLARLRRATSPASG